MQFCFYFISRIDTTRTIVESTVQHSNILSKSVKQLDEDKLRIAEFYELIYNRQKEIEEKYKTMEKFVKELEDLLNAKCISLNIKIFLVVKYLLSFSKK